MNRLIDVMASLNKKEVLKFLRYTQPNTVIWDHRKDVRLALLPWMDQDTIEMVCNNGCGDEVINKIVNEMLKAIANQFGVERRIKDALQFLPPHTEEYSIARGLFERLIG